MAKQKVLVLGGGFGGVKFCLELASLKDIELTLLTDHEDFRFYPALYMAATGKSRAASSIPLKEIFKNKPVKLEIDSAVNLDRQSKTVATKSGKKLAFDILVIALGSTTNYFGIKGLDKFSYGMKTQAEAERLRNHIHDVVVSGQNDNFIIIGGGPTGIELAGALPNYIKRIRNAHGLAKAKPHIDLVEAAPRLASRMPAGYSKAIAMRLKKLGVDLYLGQTVQAETADKIKVSGHAIDSHTVVWTAGVTGSPFVKSNGFQLSNHGKIVVDEHLQPEPGIFIIGDNADTPFSGMAQTALYDAKFAAKNIRRLAQGKKLKIYKPKKPIYVTPAGEGWAAVLWERISTYGRMGWWLREAADMVAYHDLEPFWTAEKHWLAERETDNSCPVCSHAK